MKVCVVLGAGATLANALFFRSTKMRRDRPPLDTTFFETVFARSIQVPAALRQYLVSALGIQPSEELLGKRRMEEIFKDVFFDLEDIRTTAIHEAYVDLIDLYLRILRETTNWLCADSRTGAPVGRLLAAAAIADELAVITFNHDLVIENEIQRRQQLKRRWCLDEGYGAFSAALNGLQPRTSMPVFDLHSAGSCDHTRPIKVLKLHGSLNWVVRLASQRPTINFLTGHSSPGQIHLLPIRTVGARNLYVRTGQGRSQWETWPVVVPPVYAKQALRSAIVQVWDEAKVSLEQANRVVFFGYSMPQIDVEAEKLFERALARNQVLPWVDVVDPDPTAAARYAAMSPGRPLRWHPNLDEFLKASELS